MSVAAAGMAAERRIVRELRRLGALTPESAQSLSGIPRLRERRLSRLVDAGVVAEARGGYYLVESAYGEYRKARRMRALVAVGLMMIAMAIVVMMTIALSHKP